MVSSSQSMWHARVGEASNPSPVTTRSASRILATQVDSSGIEQECTRPVEGRDVRPRRGHRRGLVAEMAPNVVDATAVDMSNSPDESELEGMLLDASRKIWLGGFAPEDGFGLGTSLDPVSASARQDAQPSDECRLWQSDVFTPVKNKRISKFEHRTDSKFWCPKRFAMSSRSWRRSTSRWQTVTPNQHRSRHHKTTGVFGGSWFW